jgi:hypothetical protein
MEILVLKHTITKVKHPLGRLNSRSDLAKERTDREDDEGERWRG